MILIELSKSFLIKWKIRATCLKGAFHTTDKVLKFKKVLFSQISLAMSAKLQPWIPYHHCLEQVNRALMRDAVELLFTGDTLTNLESRTALKGMGWEGESVIFGPEHVVVRHVLDADRSRPFIFTAMKKTESLALPTRHKSTRRFISLCVSFFAYSIFFFTSPQSISVLFLHKQYCSFWLLQARPQC